MSTDGKPPSGSSPGRPAADTPQRLVVRSLESGSDSLAGSDTAVAVAGRTSLTELGKSNTDQMPPVDRTDLVGVTLSGRYLVTRKVGQGGMGAVYEATHTLINKRVAVKVLLEKYARRDAIVARLKQEAQLASSLENEHIITITDFGHTDDGRTFVVMEFLEGESLAECLARETKLAEQRVLRIATQAASALAAAHAKGIVHRDIKPENLFLLRRKDQDFVKVVDFGISKSLRSSSEEEEQPRLTQTGMVLGTPLYMSPEQARGDENLDARVDIYAVGVIMYEATTGRVPFAGTNYLSVISQVLNEDPTPLREIRPEISEEFEAIVMRAMAKDRDQRYASANDMLTDLNALLEDPTHSTERAKITGPRRLAPKKTPRLAIWIGVSGVGVAAIVIVVMMLNGSSSTPGKQAHNVLPPVVADAGTEQAVIADAAPEAETVIVHIDSVPSGASVIGEDGREYGTTPCDIKLVVHDKDVKLIAQLAGYDDRPFSVNPIEQKGDSKPVKIKLAKAVGRAPKTTKLNAGSGAAAPQNHTNGELGGWHDPPSGTLPKK